MRKICLGIFLLVARLAFGEAKLESFIVEMGGPQKTADLNQCVSDNGFRRDADITQAHFPLSASAIRKDEIVLVPVPYGQWLSEERGLEILRLKGLERPTYEHALRFACQYGASTVSAEASRVVFLHKPWVGMDGHGKILFLTRLSAGPKLGLGFVKNGVQDYCVLAGVRHLKASAK